jgi:hypothetical protein
MSFYISEVAAFAAFFVYGSFFEWTLHKYLMHQPRWKYPFRAHALVHHGLFRTGGDYFLSDKKYLKKVRFAWWNAPFIIALHVPAILLIQDLVSAPILAGACAAMAVYYGLYEYLHYCMHIPTGRRLEQTRWFRWLDAHHHMHHKRHLNNLNVVLPLADAVFGSLISPKERIPAPDRQQGAYRMEALLG